MPNRQKRKAEQKRDRDPRPVAVTPRLRMSATKVRRLADVIRGLPVQDAVYQLDALPHRAAPIVKKTVQAAAANAVENCGLEDDLLVIQQVFVDEGFTIPRIRPRAQGRAFRIRRRTCRLTVEVAEQEE